MTKKILVLGGYGTCGRYISQVLSQDPAVECVIGGRDTKRGQEVAAALGLPFVRVEIQRASSLNAALEGAYAVVNTCGPFHWHDYAVAERCARRGVHYVDLADDRSYIMGIQDLMSRAQEGGAAIVSGGGSMLALSGALAAALGVAFDVVENIDIAVLSGNRNPRGLASMRSLLYVPTAAVRIRERGEWRDVRGWSQGRAVDLPAPLGRRHLYVTDAPEMEIFPRRYGARVTYRTGLELPILNRAVAGLASLSRFGVIGDLPSWATLMYALHRRLRGMGHAAFGLTVMMRGERAGQPLTRQAGLVAREDGLVLGCAPVITLIRKWVHGGVAVGAGPCDGLFSLDDLSLELRTRNVVLQLS